MPRSALVSPARIQASGARDSAGRTGGHVRRRWHSCRYRRSNAWARPCPAALAAARQASVTMQTVSRINGSPTNCVDIRTIARLAASTGGNASRRVRADKQRREALVPGCRTASSAHITLFVFVSDNGWEQDEDVEYKQREDSTIYNDNLLGNGGPMGKNGMYDQSFRSPTIFYWRPDPPLLQHVEPGLLHGHRAHRPRLAGVETPSGLPGYSLQIDGGELPERTHLVGYPDNRRSLTTPMGQCARGREGSYYAASRRQGESRRTARQGAETGRDAAQAEGGRRTADRDRPVTTDSGNPLPASASATACGDRQAAGRS